MTEELLQPELRRDPITANWMILAAGRGQRPHAPGPSHEDAAEESLVQGQTCPFCEGRESETPPEVSACRIGEGRDCPGWSVRVIPNKFPILANISPVDAAATDPRATQLPAAGYHEVIVDSPQHGVDPWELGPRQVGEMLETYRERFIALREDANLRYVHIIRNHRAAGAASLAHPHSQLFALPFIPPTIDVELDGFQASSPDGEGCVLCDLIKEEERQGIRIVEKSDNFIAFAPFASRLPYEVWLAPRTHRRRFEDCDCLDEMSELLTDILNRYSERLGDPPFNYWIHTYPLHGETRPYHWHLEIVPRLTIPGGLEMGAGVWVNTVAPEAAAAELR